MSTIVDISFETSLISTGAEWDIINGGMRGRLASEDAPAPVRQPRSEGCEEDDADDWHRGHSCPLRNYSSSHWWPNGLTRRSPPVVSKETWRARDYGEKQRSDAAGRRVGSRGKFDETKWSQRKNGMMSLMTEVLKIRILIPLSTLLCIIRGLENINERDEKSLTIPLSEE